MIGQTAVAWQKADVDSRMVHVESKAIAGTVAFFGLIAIALAAPFETQLPLVTLPGQSLSNLEACVALALVSWLGASLVVRARPVWRTPLTWPWLTAIAVMAAASATSPVSKANALHMTGRVAAAFAIYLLAVNGLRSPLRVRALLAAVLTASAAAAGLVVLEYLRIGAVVAWLRAFRSDFTWVGGQLRAGGPFLYPSIASMYLEVAFAFGLGLWVVDRDGRASGGPAASLLFGTSLLIADAIVLTYTRSGLIAIAVAAAFVVFLRYRRFGFDIATTLVTSLVLAVGLLVLTSRPAQATWLRFSTETQESWYRMSVEAPPEITFTADAIQTIPVAVTNLGRVTWDSRVDPPFTFSSHWYDAEGGRVVAFYGIRNVFPAPVKPGETVTLDARVRAPREAGRYQLVWDIEYKGRLWFSTEQGAASNVSRAVVSGAPAPAPVHRPDVPRAAVRPGRSVLWRAAALMVLTRPVLGFGPDNFRLVYGEYASIPSADPRVHSNNMYLELAVGAGLAGAMAFGWLFWSIARLAASLIHIHDARDAAMAAGIAAAIVAVAIHGLVDSFLGFTSTYVLFALTLGCASGLGHADRV